MDRPRNPVSPIQIRVDTVAVAIDNNEGIEGKMVVVPNHSSNVADEHHTPSQPEIRTANPRYAPPFFRPEP